MAELLRQRVEELAAALRVTTSVTWTLEKWCEKQGLVTPPAHIQACVESVPQLPVPEAFQGAFPAGERLRHRRVDLTCQGLSLCHADNWYAPSRLSPKMNARLEKTREPFGRVVRQAGIHRRTLDCRVLWTEEAPPPSSAHTPVISVLAFVCRKDGVALSLVQEICTAALLGVGDSC